MRRSEVEDGMGFSGPAPTADERRAEKDAMARVEHVQRRQTAVTKLIEVADAVCKKMEHPTESVTIIDQDNLRAAIDAAKRV